jgi:hypothetical protein
MEKEKTPVEIQNRMSGSPELLIIKGRMDETAHLVRQPVYDELKKITRVKEASAFPLQCALD